MTQSTDPICNIEAEQALIGAAFVVVDFLDDMLAAIKPEHFYRNLHQEMWRAFTNMRARGVMADDITNVTVAAELEKVYRDNDVPAALGHDRHQWPVELATFYADMGSGYGWEGAAGLVLATWQAREARVLALDLAATLNTRRPDAAEVIAKAARDLADVTMLGHISDPKPLASFVAEAREAAMVGGIGGLPSPWPDLDAITTGWKPGQLIVVAAPTGGGKSAFAAAVALRNMDAGVLMFSMEMMGREVAERMICMKAGVDSRLYAAGKLNAMDKAAAVQAEAELTGAVWIDDAGANSIAAIRGKTLRWRARHGISLVVVDYLGLVDEKLEGANRVAVVSAISRGLKTLAMEARIPVLALHQLNRDHAKEKRAPRIHDLKDSGSVEQDANQVILLYREAEGDVETHRVTVAKNRGGPCNFIKLGFRRSCTRFEQLTQQEPPRRWQ